MRRRTRHLKGKTICLNTHCDNPITHWFRLKVTMKEWGKKGELLGYCWDHYEGRRYLSYLEPYHYSRQELRRRVV